MSQRVPGWTTRLMGWHPLHYAAISVTGLVGMLALKGPLHSLMLGLAAWPVVVAAYACFRQSGLQNKLGGLDGPHAHNAEIAHNAHPASDATHADKIQPEP